ncbi:hypothetical protein W911_00260 [Hyphomicrobium nitrativorans NL23]|uniref:Uncharacterized protein n=1 Tax=Hyphomicrobium nitrativorans NL23 TaxID=1029756 RepID=V5SFY2_9HYPH|nr:hypothetical protein W911_00260 [Hyphomicrobium nitrativorans NL23]
MGIELPFDFAVLSAAVPNLNGPLHFFAFCARWAIMSAWRISRRKIYF